MTFTKRLRIIFNYFNPLFNTYDKKQDDMMDMQNFALIRSFKWLQFRSHYWRNAELLLSIMRFSQYFSNINHDLHHECPSILTIITWNPFYWTRLFGFSEAHLLFFFSRFFYFIFFLAWLATWEIAFIFHPVLVTVCMHCIFIFVCRVLLLWCWSLAAPKC